MSNTRRGPARAVRPSAPLTLRARHPMLSALVPLAAVVVVLTTMVVVKVSSGGASALSSPPAAHHARHPSPNPPADGATTLPGGVLADVTSAGIAALSGTAPESGLAGPASVPGNPDTLEGPDGKPEILYVGAEYCPYCAAERWALVEALSHFGSFSGLRATHSSNTDIDPGTATFSFLGSTYTSPSLDFVPVELFTNQPEGTGYAPLQSLTSAENRVLSTYDQSPYTSAPGSIPFISIGNRQIVAGASYDPHLLAGLSLQAIAARLGHPSSAIARAVNGTADEMTAAICSVTGGQPSSVCHAPAVTAAAKAIGA